MQEPKLIYLYYCTTAKIVLLYLQSSSNFQIFSPVVITSMKSAVPLLLPSLEVDLQSLLTFPYSLSLSDSLCVEKYFCNTSLFRCRRKKSTRAEKPSPSPIPRARPRTSAREAEEEEEEEEELEPELD